MRYEFLTLSQIRNLWTPSARFVRKSPLLDEIQHPVVFVKYFGHAFVIALCSFLAAIEYNPHTWAALRSRRSLKILCGATFLSGRGDISIGGYNTLSQKPPYGKRRGVSRATAAVRDQYEVPRSRGPIFQDGPEANWRPPGDGRVNAGVTDGQVVRLLTTQRGRVDGSLAYPGSGRCGLPAADGFGPAQRLPFSRARTASPKMVYRGGLDPLRALLAVRIIHDGPRPTMMGNTSTP